MKAISKIIGTVGVLATGTLIGGAYVIRAVSKSKDTLRHTLDILDKMEEEQRLQNESVEKNEEISVRNVTPEELKEILKTKKEIRSKKECVPIQCATKSIKNTNKCDDTKRMLEEAKKIMEDENKPLKKDNVTINIQAPFSETEWDQMPASLKREIVSVIDLIVDTYKNNPPML